MRVWLVLIFLFTLFACSGSRLMEASLKDHFKTQILEDGSKRFVYTLGIPQGLIAANASRNIGTQGTTSRTGRTNSRSKLPQASFSEQREARLLKLFNERLTKVLKTSQFCRLGYFPLDRYQEFNAVSLHGECQDSATQEDIDKF